MKPSHNAGVVSPTLPPPLRALTAFRGHHSCFSASPASHPGSLEGLPPNRLPLEPSRGAWEERSRRRSLGNAIILRREPMTITRGLVQPRLQNDLVALDKYLAFFGHMFSHGP